MSKYCSNLQIKFFQISSLRKKKLKSYGLHFNFPNFFWTSLQQRKKKIKKEKKIGKIWHIYENFLHNSASQQADKCYVFLVLNITTTSIPIPRWKGWDFNSLYFQPVAL